MVVKNSDGNGAVLSYSLETILGAVPQATETIVHLGTEAGAARFGSEPGD